MRHHVPPCPSWQCLTWLLLNPICVPTVEQHQGSTLVAMGVMSPWVEPPAMAADLSLAHSSQQIHIFMAGQRCSLKTGHGLGQHAGQGL